MSALVPLDSRQVRITRRLLGDTEPETVEEIASALRLTTRVVRYNLPSIEAYFRSAGLTVVRRRGVGVWVEGDPTARSRLLAGLDDEIGPQVLNVADRKLQAQNVDVDATLTAVEQVPNASWIAGCGSLPPGAPADFYARLVALGSADRRVAVDSSGAALVEAARAGAALIKPNLSELEAMGGRPLATLGEAVDAACDLVAKGVGAVLLSLGRDGAIYVNGEGTVTHAEARIDDAVNSVGAGDALLAGFLAAGADAAALPEAVAWSVAAVRSAGTRMRPVTDADRGRVTVHDRLDRDRRPSE